MQYEWDDFKNQQNIQKHGIAFEDVLAIFADIAVYLDVSRRADAEKRTKAVGVLDGIVVAVIFTQRGERIRIISARKANQKERERLSGLLAKDIEGN